MFDVEILRFWLFENYFKSGMFQILRNYKFILVDGFNRLECI